VDVDGNPLDLYGVTVGEAGARGLIFRCRRERLAQVRIRFRWYTHEVTFRNVSLDPGRTTQVKAEVKRLEPPAPERYAADLPGGLKVEFVGITKNTFPASDGWKPNGRPLGDGAGYWPSTIVLHSGNTSSSYVENGPHPDPDADAIDFLFRIRGLKAQPSIAFDSPASGSSYSHLPVKDPYELRVSARRRSDSRPGAPGSPADGELHVGLTDEPWSRYVRIGLDGKLLDPIRPDEPYAATHKLVEVLGTQPNERIPTGAAILLQEPSGHADPTNPWHRYAFEFRAIDTDGNEHWAIEWESQGIEGTSLVKSQRGLAEPLPAGKTLSHYEYRLRPYRHWVTFEGVSLQPGKTTNVQVKVESSPDPGRSRALIEVSATDALALDGQAMRIDEIDAALRKAEFDQSSTTIVVRADPNAAYQVIVDLVAALNNARWTRITLGAAEGAALAGEVLQRYDPASVGELDAAALAGRK
jgi:biopolymer transport protein ExbD